MTIKMIGIDHERASLKQREIFAFTPLQSEAAMKKAVQKHGVNGCIILSTCNRTEAWVSEEEGHPIDLKKMLLDLKQVSSEDGFEFEDYFVFRESDEAFYHLFRTACGSKSQIWGEDQILSQIKQAIDHAREAKTLDTIMEKLFQMAITSAKKIKTKVQLTSFDVSIATRALEKIKESYPELNGLECLVIGNGEMGKMMANQLCTNGAKVTVTIRKYKKGAFLLPKGCDGIEYDKRYEKMANSDVVVSATLSPHHTINASELMQHLKDNCKKRLFIDLAVPRDIEPDIGSMKNVTLFNMDQLGFTINKSENRPAMILANQIIAEYIDEFNKWYKMRDYLPIIRTIAMSTSARISHHMKTEMGELSLDENERITFESKLLRVSEKAVSGLLFGIKDSIAKESWDECFANLEKAVK